MYFCVQSKGKKWFYFIFCRENPCVVKKYNMHIDVLYEIIMDITKLELNAIFRKQ